MTPTGPPVRLAGVEGETAYGIGGHDIVSGRVDEAVPATTDVTDGQPVTPTVLDAFDTLGQVPSPADPRLVRRLSTGWRRSLACPLIGDVATATVFQVTSTDWITTVGPRLYSSHDACETWTHRLALPPSSGPMGILPSAVCRTDEHVYLGEYPLGDEVPRILSSADDGRNWKTVCRLPGVRHVHAVQVDPFTGDVWVTTGDADSECAIGRLRNGPATERDATIERVGGGSQAWRAVELAFTPNAILWGVDCGYASRNQLYRLARTALGADDDPVPVSVGVVHDSVYYAATVEIGGEYWVAFATAVETGRDRTAPERATTGTDTARVVVASSESDYTDWHDLLRFRRRSCVANAIPGLPSANAYVSLASTPRGDLLVNPFNTRTANGRVLVVSPEQLSGLRSD